MYKREFTLYNLVMSVTISEFRKSLFQLVDLAMQGEKVEFVYRGETFAVVPRKKRSRLERLVGAPEMAGWDMTDAAWRAMREERGAAQERKIEEEWPG